MQTIVLAALMVAVVAASSPVYVPSYGGHSSHGDSYHYGGHSSHGGHGGYGHQKGYGGHYNEHHAYYESPRPYHMEYAIDDPHYGPMMAQTEHGDDYGNKQGYYVVNLPDGRTQHVKYYADDYGFNAEVTYDGYAQYPTDKHVGYGGYGHGH